MCLSDPFLKAEDASVNMIEMTKRKGRFPFADDVPAVGGDVANHLVFIVMN